MKSRKWIKVFTLISLLFLLFIGMINYIVDPLWVFSHNNSFNAMQESFNERQQKINKIYFNGSDDYDTLLLGSSRTTYINQHNFIGMKVFNMGAGNMFPNEYEGFINSIKKIRGKEFKYIILGMDFFASNANETKHKQANLYVSKSKELFYQYKMLLGLNTLEYSIKNIFNSFQHPSIYYRRDNVRIHKIIDYKKREENFQISLQKHINTFKNKYSYNKLLLPLLQKIKNENPNTKFIIFTTPATAQLLESTLGECNRFNDYSQWLRDIVSVFGQVYHFYDFNSITVNNKNYPDDEHYYPYIGKMIATKISNLSHSSVPDDFGIILSNDNINDYLIKIKQTIEDLRRYQNAL